MTTIKIGDKDYTPEELAALNKAGVLNIGSKLTPTLQGPFQTTLGADSTTQFGIFSSPGVRPERFSALTRPRSLFDILPAPRKSIYTEQILEIMTGQTADGTTNAAYCGTPPTPGQLKTMQRVFKFGEFHMGTNNMVLPLTGALRNRADIPGELLNTGPTNNPLIPELLWALDDTQSLLRSEFYKVGVALGRSLETVALQGQQGVNNSNPGWFLDFEGLLRQIKTGYTDAVTSTPAPAADSDVINFNGDIGGTDSLGRDIVAAAHDLYYSRVDVAESTGLGGTTWAFVMRKEMFRALTEVWACNYATYRCKDGSAGSPVNRDGLAQQELRVGMMRGQYLLIDGVEVPVVFTEGLPITRPATGRIKADMLLLPISWMGTPLTVLEYFDMANAYATEINGWGDINSVDVINDGMYMVGKDISNPFCPNFRFASRMRLILEVPFLAGRIDNVTFDYAANTRVADPNNTYMHYDGGVTYRE